MLISWACEPLLQEREHVKVDGAIGGPDVGDRVPPPYDECLGW
jgi:hypothetical protein